MNGIIVRSTAGITLVGGGKVRPVDLAEALALAPCLVAADGGAATALAEGQMPQAIIGDMDSISADLRAAVPSGVLHRIEDQDSTDFDKALRSVTAPLVLGVGFFGRRIDHQLANLNVLVRRADQRCILIGRRDVVLAAPPSITLDLPPGSRLSLFPLAPVTGRSEGLHWPIDGIAFSPAHTTGTSNRVAAGARRVRLAFDGAGMLLILPRRALSAAIAGVAAAGD